jgi:hypothetical protein
MRFLSGSASCSGFALVAGKGLREPNELCHFANFFRKRFAGQILAHLWFHETSYFSFFAGWSVRR